MNFKSVVVGILIILFLTNCRQDDVAPLSSWYTSGVSTITTTPPANINRMKPVVTASDIVPGDTLVRFATQRNGTLSTPILTTLTGTPWSQIPNNILTLFTRGNSPLSEIGGDSTKIVKGWDVDTINFIESYGAIYNITTQLTVDQANALSIIITFYPDGYYTFINNLNPVNNEMGWYQLAMVNNIPVGIIYQALHSGADFKSPPQLAFSPLQSFGVWGIDENRFFPLLQMDKNTNIFLKMVPVSY